MPTPPDPYVMHRLTRNTERLRFAVNTTDELDVNAAAADYLDALYQVTRHWRDELTPSVYDDLCSSCEEGRIVAGLTWLRGQEAHHIVTPGDMTNRIAEHFYDHYGCWDWKSDAADNGEPMFDAYHDEVAGREILVSTLAAQRFLETLAVR